MSDQVTSITSHHASHPGFRAPGHTIVPGALRFTTELIAWVATPWAFWSLSIPLAIASVIVLISLPAIFGTPGDRPGGDAPVSVPGIVTILIVLATLAAAVISMWVIAPLWAAIITTVLSGAAMITEQPRWRALLRRR